MNRKAILNEIIKYIDTDPQYAIEAADTYIRGAEDEGFFKQAITMADLSGNKEEFKRLKENYFECIPNKTHKIALKKIQPKGIDKKNLLRYINKASTKN